MRGRQDAKNRKLRVYILNYKHIEEKANYKWHTDLISKPEKSLYLLNLPKQLYSLGTNYPNA